ncbi:MAG: DUF4132 domain-containing protein [Clostridiales bacterium]|jgi:hypothetical protein|nr:DUF4132 domain-containing protein [Clostridiales bacterium]
MGTETETRLTELYESDAPAPAMAGEFFSHTAAAERAALIRRMLNEKEYDRLAELIHARRIVGDGREYGAALTADARSFYAFLQICADSGVSASEIAPMLFRSKSAPPDSRLRGWAEAVGDYLLKAARADYGAVLELAAAHDPRYEWYGVLYAADPQKTVAILIDKLLNGRNTSKTRIRGFLSGVRFDAAAYLRPALKNANAKTREAAARLLLLHKHDSRAAELLREVYDAETSKSVRACIEKDKAALAAAKKSAAPKNAPDELTEAMVLGVTWPLAAFQKRLASDADFALAASKIFFFTSKSGTMSDIVVVENDKIRDLDNNETSLAPDVRVGVLHPVDIPSRCDFIRRLNLDQPVEQIKRRIFVPTAVERAANAYPGLSGTVISAADFKSRIKKEGFKILNRLSGKPPEAAAKFINDFLCVIFFSRVSAAVTLKSARFYRYADCNKLNGAVYLENVPVCPLSELGSRVYSEGILACRRLAGI